MLSFESLLNEILALPEPLRSYIADMAQQQQTDKVMDGQPQSPNVTAPQEANLAAMLGNTVAPTMPIGASNPYDAQRMIRSKAGKMGALANTLNKRV